MIFTTVFFCCSQHRKEICHIVNQRYLKNIEFEILYDSCGKINQTDIMTIMKIVNWTISKCIVEYWIQDSFIGDIGLIG